VTLSTPGAVKKVLLLVGTRPDALKMAPIVQAMRDAADFEPVVVATAQHRTMLDQVLELFRIQPDLDLEVFEQGQSLASVTSRVLERLAPVISTVEPDLVMVQGDTTSTFAGALSAFYAGVPVAHVEAGLRTGDPQSPFPEEMNRRLTSRLSDLHLSPTWSARENLIAEGTPSASVVVTGNTVIDALLHVAARPRRGDDPAPPELDIGDGAMILVTLHRRESWGEPMADVGHALADIARAEPDVHIVLPIHLNPLVREALLPPLQNLANVRVTEPVSYDNFVRLMQRCTLIVTDSGGIQEEGPSLGKPVLVARETTERPEAIAAGTARLVGTDRTRVRDSVLELLRDDGAYRAMANAINPYGDGHAARRTLDAVRFSFGEISDPDQFRPDG